MGDMRRIDTASPHVEANIQKHLQALERARASWVGLIEWIELSAPLPLEIPENQSSGDSSDTSNIQPPLLRAEVSAAKGLRAEGFIHVRRVFERGISSAISRDNPLESKHAEEAQTLARELVKEILPAQAFLFVPPDELALAAKEAEKIARDMVQQCKLIVSDHAKLEPKPLLRQELKQSVSKRIRGLRERHDARLHMFPYSEQSAPITGVATVAIIASQQQSIIGDHGRVSQTSR
jgi:hypothetical protein